MKTSILALILLAAAPAYAVGMTDFGVQAGAYWGFGKMGDSLGTIQSRTMNTLTLEALPGYKVSDFMFGPYLAYGFTGQTTDPATLGDQNLKGHGYLLGLGGTYHWTDFSFMVAAQFLGKYTLSNSDILGRDVAYGKPLGLTAEAGYHFMPMLSGGLRYSLASYKEDTVGTKTSDLSTNKRTHWELAAGASFHY